MGPNRTYQCYSQWFCAATKGWGTPFSRRGFVGCRAGGQKSRTRTLLSGVWHAKYRNQHPKWCFDGRARCAIPPPSWFKTLKIKKGTKTKRCKNQWPPPPWKWGLETQKAPKKVKFLSPSPLQRQPCKREIRKAKIQGKIPPRNFQAGIF